MKVNGKKVLPVCPKTLRPTRCNLSSSDPKFPFFPQFSKNSRGQHKFQIYLLFLCQASSIHCSGEFDFF